MLHKFEVAFAIIKKVPGKAEDEGTEEFFNLLDGGFEPFSVTNFMELREPSALAANKQPIPVVCEKIWMKRSVPVGNSSFKLHAVEEIK